MKILFTGASSFTGYWFVQELAHAGHEVVATLRHPLESYEGIRSERLQRLKNKCRFLQGVSFGDEAFIKTLKDEGNFDVLCHHGADVENYKDLSFNITRAVENNTKNSVDVMKALVDTGCGKIVLTGSVFESDEGAGSEGLQAFSPYGVSKSLTANIFRFWAQYFKIFLGKFVIPNPFGPFEEPRFTTYLAKNWFAGQKPTIQTPDYIRDNIHVSLLAKCYSHFIDTLKLDKSSTKLNPSGYVGSQKFFAELMAEEMEKRLDISCRVESLVQNSFSEPMIRINTDAMDFKALNWNEDLAWNELAEYYQRIFK